MPVEDTPPDETLLTNVFAEVQETNVSAGDQKKKRRKSTESVFSPSRGGPLKISRGVISRGTPGEFEKIKKVLPEGHPVGDMIDDEIAKREAENALSREPRPPRPRPKPPVEVVPPMPPEPPKNVLQTLQEKGYDPERVARIMSATRRGLNSRGISNFQIDQALGIAPFDTSGFQEIMVDAAREKFGEDAGKFTREVFTLDDFFSAGFNQSTLSLAFDAPSAESKRAMDFQDKTLSQEISASIGTVGGDLPAMFVGAIGGTLAGIETGPGALVTGAAGAFALPAILRTVMMDAYENGDIQNFQEFWDLLIKTGLHGAKAYLTGAATGGAGLAAKPLAKVLPGVVIPKTATLSAEVAAFTTVGAALDGRVPEPREFVVGFSTVLGIKMGTKSAGFVAQKGRDIYRKTGRAPIEVIEDMALEHTIKEDMVSENIDIPRAYVGTVDMTRRDFFKGAAASAAVLAAGGKVKLSDIALNPGGKVSSLRGTMVFDPGGGFKAVLFPEREGIDLFGSLGFNVDLKGVKDFAEAKEIVNRLPGAEEPSHLIVQTGQDLTGTGRGRIEFIDIENKTEAEVDAIVEKVKTETPGVHIMDTDFFGAHSSINEMFESTKNYMGHVKGRMPGHPDVAMRDRMAGHSVENMTDGRFIFDPHTGEMKARDVKLFEDQARELAKKALKEETIAIEDNTPKTPKIGDPEGPVIQGPPKPLIITTPVLEGPPKGAPEAPRIGGPEGTVDMTRRDFLKGAAASAAVLAGGGTIKLFEFPKGSKPATELFATIVHQDSKTGSVIMPESLADLTLEGTNPIKLRIEGDAKNFGELQELTDKVRSGEMIPDHLDILWNEEAGALRVRKTEGMSREEIKILDEEATVEGFRHLDSFETVVSSDLQGVHARRRSQYEQSFDGKELENVLAQDMREVTRGNFTVDAEGNIISVNRNTAQEMATRLEGIAREEETRAIEGAPPEAPRIGGPKDPPRRDPPSSGEGDDGGRRSPNEIVGDRISVGETEKKTPYGLHEIYEDVFDDLHPLARTVKGLTEGEKLPAHEDPYILARNLKGVSGVGDSFLEFGTLDYATKSQTGESFRNIVRPIDRRGDLEGFREFLVARRAVELDNRGIETGVDIAAAKKVVNSSKEKYEIDAKRLDVWNEELLRFVKDSGLISEEAFAAMREANKDFVPFNRVMDKEGTGSGLRTTKPIKGIKGSERQIIDPIESMIKNAYVLTTLAERNRTMNALIELSEARPDLKVARKKKASSTVSKVESKELKKLLEPYLESEALDQLSEADISVFRSKVFINDKDVIRFKDGKPEVYEVDADLARALAALDRGALDATVKILALPASLLRTGAILSPEFMARNFTRDTLSAFLFSKDGFVPVIDTLTGMGKILGRTDAYKDWVAAGGQFAHLQAIDRTYHQKGLKELLTSIPVRNVLRNPLEILRALSGLVEQGTRVQVFSRRFSKAQKKRKLFGLRKGESKSRIEAITEAAFEARDVTLDFQKFGAKTRSLNAMSAFFNAFLQGHDKLVRSFKNNPKAMTAKVIGGLVIPSVMLHLVNRTEKWYQELEQWERDLFWHVKIGDIIWKIPKPFEIGLIFATGAENMVEWMIDGDERTATEFLWSLSKAVVPNLLPQAIGVPIEAYMNKSIFLDRPIIPRDREGLLPKYRHGLYTSDTAKVIGAIIGEVPLIGKTNVASPAVIEHVIRGWTGGLGKHALDLMDKALVATGISPDNVEPTPAALSDIPLVKAFVVRYPTMHTKSITRFYDKFARQEQINKTFKKLISEGNVTEAQELIHEAKSTGGMYRLTQQRKAMSAMSKMIRKIHMIQNLEGMTREQLADWKRESIDTLYVRINDIAKTGLRIAETFEKAIDQ
jgi:hypothetical protein